MRVLIVADIHSNWVALQALCEEFDYCLVVGDIVDYGTDPLPCIDWVSRNADGVVRGNHDHAVAQRVAGRGHSGYRRLAAAARPLHWRLLDSQRMKFLGRLPVTQHVRLQGKTFYLVHASPRDPMDEYVPNDELVWKDRLEGIEADYVCVGHTHTPFHYDLGERQVINPGSIGQPRDGDPRASYAIVDDDKVTLHRFVYDIDAAIRQMQQAGLEPWAVQLNAAILKTGGRLTREEMDAIV